MQVSSIRIQLFSAFIFVLASCSSNPKISFESLLSDLVDRDKLARFPSPDFTVAQFSSYDRNMVQPGDSTWFANWDRSMFLRVEEHNGHQEYVMMDTSCAGAIVRFWMTFSGENSGKGILRIYLDGSENPVIEGPAVDILSGKLLIDGILASSVSDSTDYSMRGHNLYLPIPFGKGCKVTYESENIKDFGAKTGGESVYYNINYRKYQDAKVETFTLEQLVIHKQKLMEVQEELKSRKNDLEHLQVMKHEIKKTVNPGDSISWKLSGTQSAIRQITFKVESENLEQALRSTIVKLTFDGNLTVWTPLGDFFGTGYQIRPSHTWYTEVTKDGQMTCQWVMPYVDQVEMTILNIGTSPVFVNGLISTSDWDWDERSMYFGASWHQYSNLFTGEMKNMGGGGGPFDINFITLHGKGVYVGDAVTLFNTVYAWWGEGDEKVYVDGEPFPSHIGTGTEDYYGYAWCRPELITSHPFISQPDGSGNFDPGYTVNMRVRNLDAIPFNQQLKFDMEMWHWTRSHINFAPITFFYLHPDGIQPVVPDVENARENVVLKKKI